MSCKLRFFIYLYLQVFAQLNWASHNILKTEHEFIFTNLYKKITSKY